VQCRSYNVKASYRSRVGDKGRWMGHFNFLVVREEMVSWEFFALHSTSFRFRIRESHGSCDWLKWRRILSLNGLDGSASSRISDAYSWNHFAAKSSSTFQPLWCTYQMHHRDIFSPCDMALPMSISPDRWYPVSTQFTYILLTNHNISTTT